jgi:hypothetical protein
MVYDALDFMTFVQTTGSAVVEAFDISVNNILDDADTVTNILDLGVAAPNWDGQSIYITPRADVNGALIAGSTDATVKLIAVLFDGATSSPAGVRARGYQAVSTEMIEIPLPVDVKRYLKIGLRSDGGAGVAHITKGAVAVHFGQSSRKVD